MKEDDYIKKRNELLSRIALTEQHYQEREAFAEKMKAKADALEEECEKQKQYIAELAAEIDQIKRSLGITR